MAVAPTKNKIQAFQAQPRVWDIVKWFHIGWKFYGFACFTIDGPIENGRIRYTIVDILLNIVQILMSLFIIYLNYTKNLTLITTKSRIINLGSRIVLVYEITNVFVSLMTLMLRRKSVWGIFYKCHKLDVELSRLGIVLDHKVIHKKVLLVFGLAASLFFLMAFSTDYLLLTLSDSENKLHMLMSFMIINGSRSMTLMTADFLIYLIYVRFQQINKAIQHFFVVDEHQVLKVKKGSKILTKIVAKLAELHDSLVDIVNCFNYCFAFTLMNVVAGMFLTNIFSTFALYRVVVRHDYSQWELTVIQYIWNLYFLVYGFMVVMLGSLVTRTGKYSAVLVHKAINYVLDDEDPVIDVLKMFSQQMQHRAPIVTCGLFTFDFTLAFTIIGATATYIVILIQFDTDIPVLSTNSTQFRSNTSFPGAKPTN